MYKTIVSLCVLACVSSCTINNPGKGAKIGTIVKLSEDGIISKTCEGELIRGGLIDGSGSLGGSFKFTIENDYLKDAAYTALENHSEVIITYECEFVSSLFRSESMNPHFVKSIKIVR